MIILMPKLDWITATNLICKFDRGTPIISIIRSQTVYKRVLDNTTCISRIPRAD